MGARKMLRRLPMRPEVFLHTPRVTERVAAAAVSKPDRTRHVVRIPDAKIIEVDPVSVTTRVLAPNGPWAEEVRSIDRSVARALDEWTERHNLREGPLRRTIRPADGLVFFTLKNQPESGRDSELSVCDITAELCDIKRSSRDDTYRLVWRVKEAEFKERHLEDSDEESPEEDDSCSGSVLEGFGPCEEGPGSCPGEKYPGEECPGDEGQGDEGQGDEGPGLEERCSEDLAEISAQLRRLAEKVTALERSKKPPC